MDYKEVVFTLNPSGDFYQDLLINSLAEAGFDTFEETGSGFKAFIPASQFKETVLIDVISDYQDKLSVSFEINHIPHKNWNELWESSFEPITIGKECYVRASFHPSKPEYPYEIIINPKMAFGTGHHQTTAMMMEFMLEENLEGKLVRDMGSGTGILAFLAEKLGAATVTAIDNDPVCVESIEENAGLNNCHRISSIEGSKEAIPHLFFDIVFANINRNVLIDHLAAYSKVMKAGAELFLSGFYETDLPVLSAEAEKNNFKFQSSKISDNWTAAKFLKEK